MSLTDIDVWIGRTLFVPPIVKFCQVTGQSQFAVSRLFWFVAALDGFWRADSMVSSVIFGVMSIVMMLTASLRADMPSQSMMGFRMLAIAFLALDLFKAVSTGAWAGIEFWLLVLIAEYAATIRTIPPREEKKKAARAAQAGSR
jgi:hypothetical protein